MIEVYDTKQIIKPEEYQLGDIIIAKRYRTDNVKRTIPSGHRVGPYLVISNNNQELICCYGTSNKSYNFGSSRIYEAAINKDTFFVLKRKDIMEHDRIGFKIATIKGRDKEILKQRLDLDNNISHGLEVGNIVSYKDKLYYVRQKEDKTHLIEVSTSIYRNIIVIENKKYSFLFENEITIDNNTAVDFITSLYDDQIELVERKYQDFINNKNKSIDRGTIIESCNQLYYVYGINGDNVECYNIYENILEPYVTINGKEYSADFNDTIKVNKNALVDIIDQATESEIEKNRIEKKKYIKKENRNKSKEKNIPKRSINSGVIVCDGTLNKTKYVVISRTKEMVYLLSFEDIKNENYKNVVVRTYGGLYAVDHYDTDEFFNLLLKITQIYTDVVEEEKVKQLLYTNKA